MNPVVTTTLTSALAAFIGDYLESKGIVGATPVVLAALAGGAGVLTGVAHWAHRKFFPISATPPGAVVAVETAAVASLATPPAGVVKALALLVVLTLAITTASGLTACATAPSVNEQAAVTAAMDVATGLAVQNGTSDPAVWKARASNFKAIALQLQAVNSAGNATLATLAGDLQPLIQKLGPADVLAANALIAAVTPYLQEQQSTNTTVINTQARVALILTAVINACTVYGA